MERVQAKLEVAPEYLAGAAAAEWEFASIERAVPQDPDAKRILLKNALKIARACLVGSGPSPLCVAPPPDREQQ